MANSRPRFTDRNGTDAGCDSPSTLTLRRTSRQNTNVPMKVPSTSWLPRSAVKLRSTRGPKCDEVCASAVTVIENTTPATVMVEPAITDSTLRAPSALPDQAQA